MSEESEPHLFQRDYDIGATMSQLHYMLMEAVLNAKDGYKGDDGMVIITLPSKSAMLYRAPVEVQVSMYAYGPQRHYTFYGEIVAQALERALVGMKRIIETDPDDMDGIDTGEEG
jgi:hypothetical protein